jgi:hypothetical protein
LVRKRFNAGSRSGRHCGERVERLFCSCLHAFNAPDIREVATATGSEMGGGRPEDFAAVIRLEIAKWGGLIREAGSSRSEARVSQLHISRATRPLNAQRCRTACHAL